MSKVNKKCQWKRSIFILLFLLSPFLYVYSQANPTANNFLYPQSVYVDSPNGHVWVTDFSQHRVLRFDISGLTGIRRKPSDGLPNGFFLSQNYPNPFNPTTYITFRLKESGQATISVMDILGQQVGILFDGYAVAGTVYSLLFDAQHLASGIYLYVLRSKVGIESKKMTLIK